MAMLSNLNAFAHQKTENPFRWEISFPTNLKLRNARVFQSFESAIIINTTARLTRWTTSGIQGDLAEKWNVSSDGKKIHFFLRRDGRFSDGSIITASDVIWSVQRHFALRGQLFDEFSSVIEGANQIKSPEAVVAGLHSLNDFEFVVTLNQPSRKIIDWLFGTLPTSIFKKNSISSTEDEINPGYPSSGLYVIKDFSHKSVVLELNKYHWLANEKGLIKEVLITPSGKDDLLQKLLDNQTDYARKVFSSRINKAELTRKGLQFISMEPVCMFLRANFAGPILSKYGGIAPIVQHLVDREKLVDSLDNNLFITKPKPMYSWSGRIETIEKQFGKIPSDQILEFKKTLQQNYSEVFAGKSALKIGIAKDSAELSEVGTKLVHQLKQLGVNSETVFRQQADISAAEQDNSTDFTLTSYELSSDEPALTLPYLVGLNPLRMHLPQNHKVYQYKKRFTTWPRLEHQVEIIKEFNIIMRKEGIIVPLLVDDNYSVFSDRFDISRVPSYTFYWRLSDLRVKGLQ